MAVISDVISLFFFATLFFISPAVSGATLGTWTPMSIPSSNMSLLLTDGSVMMALGTGYPSNSWARLKPDISGNYLNGTVQSLASMHDTRLFFASVVLNDGNVFVAGGEMGTGTGAIEIYHPLTDIWTGVTSWIYGDIGDSTAKVLPDGRVLLLPRLLTYGYIYDPTGDTWTVTGAKLYGDINDEESAILLPDGNVVNFNIWDSRISNSSIRVSGTASAQRYLPSSNLWVAAGVIPNELVNHRFEIGPAALLYDGRVISFGGTGNTAIYSPSSGGWSVGPPVPNSMAFDDAPAAVMPNGRVLVVADSNNFTSPSAAFEYDPNDASFTEISSPSLGFSTSPAFGDTMLILPNGQIMLNNDVAQEHYLYTPAGQASDHWRPTISSISANADGSFTILGTQLNGLTEGAYYGDDVQMSSNYPIIRLSNSSGEVYYARSYGFSTMGVATGPEVVSAKFSVSGIPLGSYSLNVITNGISSDPAVIDLVSPSIRFNGNPFVLTRGSSVEGITPINSGGVIRQCAASPLLPKGLNLSNDCVISGIPSEKSYSANYSITATNVSGSSLARINIKIHSPFRWNPMSFLTFIRGWIFNFEHRFRD